jgi:putative ABC transport system permease protein
LEKNLATIVSIFALFTLLIAAFGLFGLALFIGKTRTKEIGIKKVFGSSEQSIVHPFIIENFTLAAIASFLSVPITIYIMTKWLNDFSYKVNISWPTFLITFAVAIIVVLFTGYF